MLKCCNVKQTSLFFGLELFQLMDPYVVIALYYYGVKEKEPSDSHELPLGVISCDFFPPWL